MRTSVTCPPSSQLEEAGFAEAEQWSEGSWAWELTAEDRCVLTSRDVEGRIIGVATFGCVADMADLHRVVVHAEARGRGVGAALVRAGIEWAQAVGADRMLLEVRPDNASAVGLYQRLGFVPLSRRGDYYGTGGGRPGDVPSAGPSRRMGSGARMSGPLILGIESSCDETGVGIVRGHELLANEVASSVDLHARFGGVVPEVASRAHLQALVPTLRRACERADVDLAEVDGIAVTAGPGLMGALVVGLAAAKALALALNKPLYGLNHLVGHVAVDLLDHGPLPQPCAALLVSGGHTSLLAVNDITGDIVELGATIDDAAGEAYDKVARAAGPGLPRRAGDRPRRGERRPGRRSVSHAGSPPRKDLVEHRFDFSFSGLKTAVSRWVETRRRDGLDVPVADVAASFQEAVCDVLTAKAIDACAASRAPATC